MNTYEITANANSQYTVYVNATCLEDAKSNAMSQIWNDTANDKVSSTSWEIDSIHEISNTEWI